MSTDPFSDFQPATPTGTTKPSSALLQPTPSTPVVDDLSDTADQLDTAALASGRTATATAKTTTGKANPAKKAVKKTAKSSGKRSTLLAQPAQSIDAAIAAGVPLIQLDALLKAWSAFNEQQALLKAKEERAALANSISDRRRVIADELLALADSLGIPMAEARKIFADAMEAQRNGKSK